MIDINKHNEYLWSMKDLSGGVNLLDSKWDFIFKDLKFDNIQFRGERLLGNKGLFSEDVTNESLIYINKTNKLVATLIPSNLIFRGLLASYWDMYEFSMLYCYNGKKSTNKVSTITPLEFYFEFNSVVMYKSTEEDVLWFLGK